LGWQALGVFGGWGGGGGGWGGGGPGARRHVNLKAKSPAVQVPSIAEVEEKRDGTNVLKTRESQGRLKTSRGTDEGTTSIQG